MESGVDHHSCDLGNSHNIPAEAVELEYPTRVWSHKTRIDSCSRRIAMICSSVNRLRFIVRLLP